MINKPPVPKDTSKQSGVSHPGMMGDGTEEQNLDERGNPAARITEDELEAAFWQTEAQEALGSDASARAGRLLLVILLPVSGSRRDAIRRNLRPGKSSVLP